MENEENEALVRHFYKELDTGNLDAVDEAFDVACVMHYPGNATLHGPEGYKSNMDPFLTGLPDFEHVVDDIFSVGDKVVVRFTILATHTGEFAGLAPTGKKISFTVMGVFRIDEGKIAEMWVEYDALGLMQQLDRREATKDLGQETDRQAVMAVFDGILAASESGDPQGYVGWLTDDAVMMYSGQPAVVGREAIRSFIDEFFANNTFQFDPWQSEEIQVDGSLAFHRYSGVATIAAKNGGQAIELDRKYIDILRKEGGSWKVSHHIFNTNK